MINSRRIKRLLTGITVALLSACATDQMGVRNLPSYGPATLWNVGDKVIWASPEGKNQATSVVTSVLDDKITWQRANGSTMVHSTNFTIPPLAWNDSREGGIGTGQLELLAVEGDLFPLQVGNKTKVSFKNPESTSEQTQNIVRNCQVMREGNVKLPAGEFNVFETRCLQGGQLIVWFYAPELQHHVASFYLNAKTGKPLLRRVLYAIDKVGS